MGKLTEHANNTSVDSDQGWVSDVSDVLMNFLNWTGTAIKPYVENVVFNGSASTGIKVDHDTEQFGWEDLLGAINVDREAASNKPSFNTYVGNVKQYQFIVDDQVYINYHIPHDIVPNSNLYIHTHWSADSNTGSATWEVEAAYASGHDGGAFSSPVTVTINEDVTSNLSHMVTESQLSAPAGAGGLLVAEDIEIDGIIMVRVKLAAETLAANPFLHFVDIHYQSTGIGTLNKAPNFYKT